MGRMATPPATGGHCCCCTTPQMGQGVALKLALPVNTTDPGQHAHDIAHRSWSSEAPPATGSNVAAKPSHAKQETALCTALASCRATPACTALHPHNHVLKG